MVTVAARIEDAALRGRQARSDAEVRITAEQRQQYRANDRGMSL
jgi:hypothetical protein